MFFRTESCFMQQYRVQHTADFVTKLGFGKPKSFDKIHP
jgi:hypothetical protein